jgi:hypothetical protein
MVKFEPILVMAQQGRTLLERLDPATRVKVIAALAGLVILGFGLVLLVWLGGRATRRYMSRSSPGGGRRRQGKPNEDDWVNKPLNPSSERASPDDR